MAYVGILAIIYVLISQFKNSSQGIPTVASKIVDVSQVQMGEVLFITWAGRPVVIYKRQDAEFSTLRTPDERLRDASSQSSDQPEEATNVYRSVQPEWFVAIALGTDQGCSLKHVPADESVFQQQSWQGGFMDSCRKSRYDLAGRVYKSQYATRNLVVPPYRVAGETIVLGR